MSDSIDGFIWEDQLKTALSPEYIMAQASPPVHRQIDRESIFQWVTELGNADTRENALLQLSKNRDAIPDMGPILWHSFGTIAVLLTEITNLYPILNCETLTVQQSNRVCYANSLLQSVALHPDTRRLFLQARTPIYLYPFLHTTYRTNPFEYLKLTSLGVTGAMVKSDDPVAIEFLLRTDFFPICFTIMESGSEMTKAIAIYTLQKILLDDFGLTFFCEESARLSQLASTLSKMVSSLVSDPSVRLLRHVVRCYLRLADNDRAREALRQCIPDQLTDDTFIDCIEEDRSTKLWLQQLLIILEPTRYPLAMLQYTI